MVDGRRSSAVTGHIGLARIYSERKRLAKEGKGSESDVRYEWQDLQSFQTSYVDQVRDCTAFYFEVIDCERPCHFYATFPVNENTFSLDWLVRHVTPVIIDAVRGALVAQRVPVTTPHYWSDGTFVHMYWDELTFTTPAICGRFVKSSIGETLQTRGVQLNMTIYPTDDSDWSRPRLVRFPFSGKRLGGKAVETLRPITRTNSTTTPSNNHHHDLIKDIRRAIIAVTALKSGQIPLYCIVDEVDGRAYLVPKMQTWSHSPEHQGHL